MKNLLRSLFLLAASFNIFSCAYTLKPPSVEISGLNGSSAKMDMKNFFNGNIEAFAISRNKEGKIIESSNIKIEGSWEDNKGVLKKIFKSHDGKKDSRTWLVTINSDGTFEAIGHDILSPAKGKQSGNVAKMVYSLSMPFNGVRQEVSFEDEMYLVDSKSMIMISSFKAKDRSSGETITSFKKLDSSSQKSADDEAK